MLVTHLRADAGDVVGVIDCRGNADVGYDEDWDWDREEVVAATADCLWFRIQIGDSPLGAWCGHPKEHCGFKVTRYCALFFIGKYRVTMVVKDYNLSQLLRHLCPLCSCPSRIRQTVD